jgi:cytochrome c peroxidase
MKNNLLSNILMASMFMFIFCSCDPGGTTTLPEHFELATGELPMPAIKEDNLLTVEGVKLGRMLFYEKILSGNNTQSCGSCHHQQFAFSDTTTLSIGIEEKEGKRNTMSIFNLASHSNEFFWDGRAHLVRDQVLRPIQDELEMNESMENVIMKLSASPRYKGQFENAFGSAEINSEKISLALEQFILSIISMDSKYDQSRRGEVVLSTSEERGRILFFTGRNVMFPALSGPDCAHCHGGANFDNNQYANNGLDDDASLIDIGREAVTANAADHGKFKVPSLRNIALTAPYMHDGRFKTIEEVIDHYDHGVQASSTLDPALAARRENGLKLSAQDKADLKAFLESLSDPILISNPAYADPF